MVLWCFEILMSFAAGAFSGGIRGGAKGGGGDGGGKNIFSNFTKRDKAWLQISLKLTEPEHIYNSHIGNGVPAMFNS